MLRFAPLALLALTAVATAEEEHGYLGVRLGELNPVTRARYEIAAGVQGALVLEVLDDTPAAAAGLRAGDVVLAFDGQPVADREALIATILELEPGKKTTYRVRRGTGVIEGKVTLGHRRDRTVVVPQPVPTPMPPRERREGARKKEPVERAKADLDRRLDRAQKEIDELRRRLLEARERAAPLRHPRSLGGWIHREERLADEARKRGDQEKMRYHAIRLSVLREMREVEFSMPARKLDRIEKKLDEVLQELRRMR